MAAPTDVLVEAISITSTIIYWTYSGLTQIGVWRSTDGISYAEVTNTAGILRVPVGTTDFTDIDLTPATKYWYKVSDDGGATFSSVVTVITHTCEGPSTADIDTTMPRAEGQVTPENFNDLAVRIETGWTRFTDSNGRICVACISDGALVIDCINYDQCEVIQVNVDQDINSISLPNCVNNILDIEFFIPANSTRRINGWPNRIGAPGGRPLPSITTGAKPKKVNATLSCKCADLAYGAIGLTKGFNCKCEFDLRRPPGTTTTSKSGARPSSTCTCVPNNGLTIKSCNANNSLKCSTTKSLQVKVCGGVGPYTWSKTGDIVLSATIGASIKVTPPTNSGSGVAGTAYWVDCYACATCSGSTCTSKGVAGRGEYGCDDSWTSALPGDPTPCDRLTNCTTSIADSVLSSCCNNGSNVCQPGTPCVDVRTNCDSGVSQTCDKRSAQMITDGCNPCGLQSGATVSVTDALGTVATIILRA